MVRLNFELGKAEPQAERFCVLLDPRKHQSVSHALFYCDVGRFTMEI